MSETSKSPNEYLKKPYSRIVIPDEESGTYTAQILEFPGCITEGKTPQEAYERLEDVALSWIQSALGMGQDIPSPLSTYDCSGKIALRLPKSLHKQAIIAAEREGTSLNQFIVMAISEKVGASNFFNYLVEEFDRHVAHTYTNVESFILSKTSFQPTSYVDEIIRFTSPYYTAESSLTRTR